MNDYRIAMYVNTKTLTSDKDNPYTSILENGLNNWKNWSKVNKVAFVHALPTDSNGENSWSSVNNKDTASALNPSQTGVVGIWSSRED